MTPGPASPSCSAWPRSCSGGRARSPHREAAAPSQRIALALVALALVARVADGGEPQLARIDLVPLGAELSAADTELVRTALTEVYGAQVRVRAVAPLPRAAWYAPRKRWRADRILTWLAALPDESPDGGNRADRILGLTAVDISTTKGKVFDWGVLGLASIDGRVGVLSRFRCDKEGKDPVRARIRLAKVAVHELGHTLGLEHCARRGCLMEDAEGQVATCEREYDLCPRCRGLLAAQGYKLPPSPKLPWPEP